jgi:hypothetical protein
MKGRKLRKHRSWAARSMLVTDNGVVGRGGWLGLRGPRFLESGPL